MGARACSVEGIFVDNLFAFLISGTPIAYETYGHNEEPMVSVARSLAVADIQTDFHSRPLTETELAAAEGPTTPISLTVVLMVRSRLTARFERKKTISNCKISCTVTILNQQHR